MKLAIIAVTVSIAALIVSWISYENTSTNSLNLHRLKVQAEQANLVHHVRNIVNATMCYKEYFKVNITDYQNDIKSQLLENLDKITDKNKNVSNYNEEMLKNLQETLVGRKELFSNKLKQYKRILFKNKTVDEIKSANATCL